ncbi:MAG TPA: hypothetical protein VHX39_35345 [Acetobacteraceae bacterium]|jgi:hypothetical protein|nr:hypothetical protein [Acetobacteraceae bacterium]
MLDLQLIGETMMKKTRSVQRNLFDMPATLVGTRLPQSIQTAPLKLLVQALLADLIAAPRPTPTVPGRMDEVKS